MICLSNVIEGPPAKVFILIPARYTKPSLRHSYRDRLVYRFIYGALVYQIIERWRRSRRFAQRYLGPIIAKKVDKMPHNVVNAAYESYMYQVQNHNTPHPNYFLKTCENNFRKHSMQQPRLFTEKGLFESGDKVYALEESREKARSGPNGVKHGNNDGAPSSVTEPLAYLSNKEYKVI